MAEPALPASRILREEYFQRERDLLAQLAREGQKPRVMFVGCSDSRVIPEWLAGARPGDLFVVRNVANIIPPYGTAHVSMGAAIEFAVDRLRVEHLIVCGHTDCGGLQALAESIDAEQDPLLARWLRFARDAERPGPEGGGDAEAGHLRFVERNVLLQLEHAAGYPAVRRALAGGHLKLHGWLYDLHGPRVSSYDRAEEKFLEL